MKPQPLNKKDITFCAIIGFIGIAIVLATLFQHFAIMSNDWEAVVMMVVYVVVLCNFIMLVLKKAFAGILLIISSILCFSMELYHIFSYVFSPILIILSIYCFISLAMFYINELPQKLKSNRLYLKNENSFWDNRI